MTAAEADENRQVIKEFAKSVSTQAQVANRIWLSLMTVALVALLPREAATAGKVNLPFGLGDHVLRHCVLYVGRAHDCIFFSLRPTVSCTATGAFVLGHNLKDSRWLYRSRSTGVVRHA